MWVEDHAGERKNVVMQGERCTFKAVVRFNEAVEDPSFAVSWVNEFHQNHFVVNTAVERERTGRFAAGEEVVFSVSFTNVLAPGRYDLSVLLAHRGSGTDIIDRWERRGLGRRRRDRDRPEGSSTCRTRRACSASQPRLAPRRQGSRGS